MKTQITHLRHSVRARLNSPRNLVLESKHGGGRRHNMQDNWGKTVLLGDTLQTVPQIVKDGGEVYPYGGITRVSLVNDNNEVVAFGEAKCCLDDLFCKRKGIEIALGRAKKNLTLANKPL